MSSIEYVLNVNKTKMYKLVKEKSTYPLPIMKEADFTSFKHSCWLDWYSDEDLFFTTYFSAVCGKALLRIVCSSDNYDKVFSFDFEYLKENGLVKEKVLK